MTVQVLDELRRMITSGELEGGRQVIQDSLAAKLGVSRVPLREALKVLEGEGHVVYRPHRGYFVTELSVADLEEAYRIRALLEAEALAVAVPLLSDEDIERIDALRLAVSLPLALETWRRLPQRTASSISPRSSPARCLGWCV